MGVLVIIIHIIVCFVLIAVVLLQSGKGADMGAAFGGGSSQTLFGSSGAGSFLGKATTFSAVIFMITCLILAYLSSNQKPSSIMEDIKAPVEKTSSALPSPATEDAMPPVASEASKSADVQEPTGKAPVSTPAAGHGAAAPSADEKGTKSE